MIYETLGTSEFFEKVKTELSARQMIWKARFNGSNFNCPNCGCVRYYELKTRPEIRKCAACKRHIRLRAGTIFQDSRLPLLVWVKAIYFVMQGKRGISVMELKRHLGMKSYGTTPTSAVQTITRPPSHSNFAIPHRVAAFKTLKSTM
jgi:predicted RNA-binding Zn-ribbon protein involved in translation (DUF1610 family)